MLDLPDEKVVVHQTRVGGGFGRQADERLHAARRRPSRRRSRVPVKCNGPAKTISPMISSVPPAITPSRARSTRTASSTLGPEHFITFTADGKKPASGGDYSGYLTYSTKAPNLRRGITMMDLKIPTGPWRAPGDNAQVFAQQSFMHELSVASGRDHVQFLLDAVNRDVPELAPKDTKKVNFSPARAIRRDQALRREGRLGQEAAQRQRAGPGLVLFPCRPCRAGGRAQRGRQEAHHHPSRGGGGRYRTGGGHGGLPKPRRKAPRWTASPPRWACRSISRRAASRSRTTMPIRCCAFPSRPGMIEAYFIQSDNPPTGMGEPALPGHGAGASPTPSSPPPANGCAPCRSAISAMKSDRLV